MKDKRGTRPELTPAGRLDEDGLVEVLGYQIAQAAMVVHGIFEAQVGRPMKLRPVEYTVLMLIAANPGVTQARLARALSVTPPRITAIVDSLEQRGYMARDASATDRRAQVLKISATGQRMARQATEKISATERETLPLSTGELTILRELLHKVAVARERKA